MFSPFCLAHRQLVTFLVGPCNAFEIKLCAIVVVRVLCIFGGLTSKVVCLPELATPGYATFLNCHVRIFCHDAGLEGRWLPYIDVSLYLWHFPWNHVRVVANVVRWLSMVAPTPHSKLHTTSHSPPINCQYSFYVQDIRRIFKFRPTDSVRLARHSHICPSQHNLINFISFLSLQCGFNFGWLLRVIYLSTFSRT